MTALPVSAPYTGAAELHRWTLDDFRGLRALRAALRAALTEVEVDEMEKIAVVATELATNALRYGRPPTEVRLMSRADRLVVDVADRELAAEPVFDLHRPPGGGGLGLVLACHFALDVGWYKTASAKHVWASFSG